MSRLTAALPRLRTGSWGLRDYGTGAWEGGDAECDHLGAPFRTKSKLNENWGAGFQDVKNAEGREPMGQVCGKCGARRIDNQLGLEPTPELYVAKMVELFREVRRVLAPHGTCWVNLGDSYGAGSRTTSAPQTVHNGEWRDKNPGRVAGVQSKQLVGIPWRIAFALQADGWYLRSDIVWSKPNPMPESVTDRPTKAHEFVFLLAKGQWKTRVVQLANLDGKRIHFGDDIRTKNAAVWAHDFGVRLATAILDSAKLQDEFGLPPLDAEVWQESGDDFAGSPIASHPVEHRAAVYSSRFLASDVPAKEFLQQLDGLGIALADRDEFLVLGRASIPLPPGVDRYGKTAIAIHDSGEICELDFAAHSLKFSSPGGCSYFFDQEAVREPWGDHGRDDMRTKGVRTGLGYLQQGPLASNSAKGPDGRRKTTVQGQDGSLQHRNGERWPNSGRNIRSVWEIATQPYSEAHFATYPEELVRRCILAGCPEQVCRECGKPRERIVEREFVKTRGNAGPNISEDPQGYDKGSRMDHPLGYGRYDVQTLGFTDCGHNAYRPGIVLDPFGGSGTTALVARKHGRHSLLIELNESYCAMAAKRTQQLSLIA